MTKLYRIGLWSVGFVALVCACTETADPAAPKDPVGSDAGSGGNGASGGALDDSAGADASAGGTDTSAGGTDTSAGGADGSAGGADTSAGGAQNPVVVDPNACNALPIDAPLVAATAVPLAPGDLPPMPAGGTIADGKYFLTAHQSYGIDSSDLVPATYRTVIVVNGAELQLAQIKDGVETRVTFNVTTSDKHFHADTTCPGPGQSLAYDSYTATDDKLVLFDDEKIVTLTLQ